MSLEFKGNGYSRLIHLVRQYPILYDDSENTILDSSRFRSHQKKSNDSWIQVASQLGISSGECKRRWKHLREVHTKIQKRRQDFPNFPRKWLYEKAMDFLNVGKPEEPKIENPNREELQQEKNNLVYQVLNTEPQNEGTEKTQIEYLEIGENDEYSFIDDQDHNKFEEVESQETICQNSNDPEIDNKEFEKYVIFNPQNHEENAENIPEYQPENQYQLIIKQDLPEMLTTGETKSENKLKRKHATIEEKSEEEENKISEKRKRSEESNNDFFERIAEEVSKMSPKAQVEAKMEVLRIVSMAEIRSSVRRSTK